MPCSTAPGLQFALTTMAKNCFTASQRAPLHARCQGNLECMQSWLTGLNSALWQLCASIMFLLLLGFPSVISCSLPSIHSRAKSQSLVFSAFCILSALSALTCKPKLFKQSCYLQGSHHQAHILSILNSQEIQPGKCW